MKKNILDSISGAMKLSLRRTLVRSVMRLNNMQATNTRGRKATQAKMFVCLCVFVSLWLNNFAQRQHGSGITAISKQCIQF